MRAGALRDRVTIQSRATSDDGAGGKTLGSWSAVSGMSRIPARVAPQTATEAEAAQQVQSNVDYEVTVRYRTGIKPAMRALWHANDGDRALRFVAPPQIVGHYDGLLIQAREDVD